MSEQDHEILGEILAGLLDLKERVVVLEGSSSRLTTWVRLASIIGAILTPVLTVLARHWGLV